MKGFAARIVIFFSKLFKKTTKKEIGPEDKLFDQLKEEAKKVGYSVVSINKYPEGRPDRGGCTMYWIFIRVPSGTDIMSLFSFPIYERKGQEAGEKLSATLKLPIDGSRSGQIIIMVSSRGLRAIGFDVWRKNCVEFLRNIKT